MKIIKICTLFIFKKMFTKKILVLQENFIKIGHKCGIVQVYTLFYTVVYNMFISPILGPHGAYKGKHD